MKRLYNLVTEHQFARCHRPARYKKLLFCLTFFHSVLLERRKFLTLGWNIAYDFNDSDFEVGFFDRTTVEPHGGTSFRVRASGSCATQTQRRARRVGAGNRQQLFVVLLLHSCARDFFSPILPFDDIRCLLLPLTLPHAPHPAGLGEPAEHLPGRVRGHAVGRAQVPDRRDQLRRPRDGRVGPPSPAHLHTRLLLRRRHRCALLQVRYQGCQTPTPPPFPRHAHTLMAQTHSCQLPPLCNRQVCGTFTLAERRRTTSWQCILIT